MKKLFLILTLFAIALTSCSLNDDPEDVKYEVLPVSEVVLPDAFKVNNENEIKVRFIRPTNCHAFNGFYYDKKENIRTIAVETVIVNNNNCAPLTENNVATQVLKFTPKEPGNYTLKFWQGKNEQDEDIFLTYDIVVEM